MWMKTDTSMSAPIELLYNETEEYLAICEMRGKRKPTAVRVEYRRHAGKYTFRVLLDGLGVAEASDETLERTASECREKFAQWADKQGA
jgi:hypothetical protein